MDLIAQETGTKAMSRGCDTTDADQVSAAATALRAEFGPADVMVNNAGIVGSGGPLESISRESWQRVLDVNVTGHLLCTQEFGADMLERGSGSIVHVSSICGVNPLPNAGAYSPSKAAVSMLSRQLASEWATRGVRHTPLTADYYSNPSIRKPREQLVPAGRIGVPEDVADAFVWLTIPLSSYVTGQQILNRRRPRSGRSAHAADSDEHHRRLRRVAAITP
ncbi:SDR family NAD(P)-dependent oxidoreductase [Rhodococcus koreensis]|uniref:SDR family NAD(P)-dependent oxidoreductase n=1 Tax=Rhodococcus koreensis TaxID=99653 RepID=UPI00366B2783